MREDQVLALHEKLYFHEIEAREKLTARLQLSFVVLSAIIAAWLYVLGHINFSGQNHPFNLAIFLVAYSIATVLIGVACLEFIRALWGHSYVCLPIATEIEKYRVLLFTTYEKYEDGKDVAEQYFSKFMARYYSECSADNSMVNSRRYDRLHDCTSYLVYSVPYLLISGVVFVLAHMGK